MNQTLKGYVAATVAAVTYGMNPLFALPLYENGMDADSVLFFRYLFAIPLLGCMIKARGRSFRLKRNEILPLVVSGTCNAWGDTPFTMDENGLMIAENVTFTNPEDGSKARFKIRFANDTDFSDGYNIGSPDDNPKEGTFSVTAKSSKDINVTPGTYDITFDFKTMTVTLTASQN